MPPSGHISVCDLETPDATAHPQSIQASKLKPFGRNHLPYEPPFPNRPSPKSPIPRQSPRQVHRCTCDARHPCYCGAFVTPLASWRSFICGPNLSPRPSHTVDAALGVRERSGNRSQRRGAHATSRGPRRRALAGCSRRRHRCWEKARGCAAHRSWKGRCTCELLWSSVDWRCRCPLLVRSLLR